jgi:hypothetical protein
MKETCIMIRKAIIASGIVLVALALVLDGTATVAEACGRCGGCGYRGCGYGGCGYGGYGGGYGGGCGGCGYGGCGYGGYGYSGYSGACCVNMYSMPVYSSYASRPYYAAPLYAPPVIVSTPRSYSVPSSYNAVPGNYISSRTYVRPAFVR